MTFWSAAFWGFVWTVLIFIIGAIWVSIFNLNLNIPFSAFLISIPVVWVAVTLFILFAPEKIQHPVMIAGGVLVFLSLFADKIAEWIENSKK